MKVSKIVICDYQDELTTFHSSVSENHQNIHQLHQQNPSRIHLILNIHSPVPILNIDITVSLMVGLMIPSRELFIVS